MKYSRKIIVPTLEVCQPGRQSDDSATTKSKEGSSFLVTSKNEELNFSMSPRLRQRLSSSLGRLKIAPPPLNIKQRYLQSKKVYDDFNN